MKNIITFSNSKLGGEIGQINMPKGLTCRHDAPCALLCYCNRGNLKFQTVRNAHMERYRLYKENPTLFFSMIENEISLRKFIKLYRWHATGDICDLQYLCGMIDIASKFPDKSFLCFTKQTEIVNEYMELVMKGQKNPIPSNLIIVFSAWGNWIPMNPYNFPMAYIHLKSKEGEEYIPQDAKPCLNQVSGHSMTCADCFIKECSCWQLKKCESIAFKQH